MNPIRKFVCMIALTAVASASCATAAYEKCVKPEITAATKLAPADLAKDVGAFLICDISSPAALAVPCAVDALASLAKAIGPGGDEAVNCLIAYYENNGTAVQQARAKAVGAKRGVTPMSCNNAPAGVAMMPTIDTSSWSTSNAIPIYDGKTSDLMQTNYVTAVGDMSALTGDITTTDPFAISDDTRIRFSLDLGWFSSPGWFRVRGGALAKWSAGRWDIVNLQPGPTANL